MSINVTVYFREHFSGNQGVVGPEEDDSEFFLVDVGEVVTKQVDDAVALEEYRTMLYKRKELILNRLL